MHSWRTVISIVPFTRGRLRGIARERAASDEAVRPDGFSSGEEQVVVWLGAERRELGLPSPHPLLLEVLDAHGIPYRLRSRAWQAAGLGQEPLLVGVGDLAEPLEIVHNGRLACVGVAHLRLSAGDEVVIGTPAHLRAAFPFFR